MKYLSTILQIIRSDFNNIDKNLRNKGILKELENAKLLIYAYSLGNIYNKPSIVSLPIYMMYELGM